MTQAWMRRASFYLATDVASRILPFFALPLLAKKMGAAEFGQYAVLLTLVNTLAILVGFSTHSAVNIAYFKRNADWKDLAQDLLSFWSCVVFFLIFVSLAFSWYWAGRMFLIGLFAAYCAWVFQLVVVVIHFKEKIFFYAVLQFLRALLLAGFPLGVVLMNFRSSEKVFLAFAFANFILLGVGLAGLFREGVRFKLASMNWKEIRLAHSFSLPMVINGVSGWLRASYDRYILMLLGSATAVGVYSLGFQLGSIIGVAGLSLSKVSSNYILKYLGSVDLPMKNRLDAARRVLLIFVFLNFFILISFLCMAHFLFHVFFEKEYENSYWVIVLVAVAFFLQTYSSLLTPFFQYSSKHLLLGRMAIFLSFLSAVIVYFSISLWSYFGAALSFLAIWVLHAGIVTFLLKKNFKSWFVAE